MTELWYDEKQSCYQFHDKSGAERTGDMRKVFPISELGREYIYSGQVLLLRCREKTTLMYLQILMDGEAVVEGMEAIAR